MNRTSTYIETIVDVMREPVLLLDKDLKVMSANDAFYRTFQTEPRETEGRLVYELGDGDWDIPPLHRLLDEILPKNNFFNGLEMSHEFPNIGRKSMILNARMIREGNTPRRTSVPVILIAMEDISEVMLIADTLAGHL